MNSRLREIEEKIDETYFATKNARNENQKINYHPIHSEMVRSVRQKIERYPPLIADYETFMPLGVKDIFLTE